MKTSAANNKLKAGVGSQIAGGFINLILSGLKIYIGTATNCVSILADGYNNAGDLLGNAGGVAGLVLSEKKPTEKYPHGYGRAEQLITFLMLLIYALVGFYFIYSSVERLFYHPPIMFSYLSLYLVLGTAAVKAGTYFLYRYAYSKNPSPIIEANKLDSVMDTLITLMTAAAYGVSSLTLFPIDSVIGIVIGCTVLYSVVKLLVKTVRELIGREDGEAKEAALSVIKEAGLPLPADIRVNSFGRRSEVTAVLGTEKDGRAEEVCDKLAARGIYMKFIFKNGELYGKE